MNKRDQFSAPIFQRLAEHAAGQPVSFHVPGHRYGEAWRGYEYGQQGSRPLEQETLARFGSMLPIDVTELSTTDDLHAPEGVIAESQRMAAALYGADETMLLVGGSTAGNVAMILAVCEPGDTIIVQRNVHKSIVNGLRLAGARAVFVRPAYESSEGTAIIPQLHHIEKALQTYPEAKAVLLSTPNYYGYAAPLGPYAELAHRYGVPLLVDEAHGAHYGLHEAFPPSALSQGADVVVQSTHKTLPAMTMGAMLHVRSSRIDVERLREMLTVVQSSSPSYPIMASLDIARAMAQSARGQLFETGLLAAESIRNDLQRKAGRLTADGDHSRSPGGTESSIMPRHNERRKSLPPDNNQAAEVRHDPLRVVIRDRLGLVSGYELQRMLERYGCWAEMADERRVLLICGPYVSQEDTARLIAACEAIESDLASNEGLERIAAGAANLYEEGDAESGAVSEPVPFSLRRINRDSVETVPLHKAAGCISAETIIPYPPGIPLIYAGETISAGIVSELERLSALGAKVQGAADTKLHTIRIIRS